MSPELLAILLTAAWQTAGIVILGVLVYRQERRFSPGEAAIMLEMRRLLDQGAPRR